MDKTVIDLVKGPDGKPTLFAKVLSIVQISQHGFKGINHVISMANILDVSEYEIIAQLELIKELNLKYAVEEEINDQVSETS